MRRRNTQVQKKLGAGPAQPLSTVKATLTLAQISCLVASECWANENRYIICLTWAGQPLIFLPAFISAPRAATHHYHKRATTSESSAVILRLAITPMPCRRCIRIHHLHRSHDLPRNSRNRKARAGTKVDPGDAIHSYLWLISCFSL